MTWDLMHWPHWHWDGDPPKLPSTDTLLVWLFAFFVGASGADNRVTLGYIIGIVGVAAFHISKSAILWSERRQTIRSLADQIANLKETVQERDRENDRLLGERDSREQQRLSEISDRIREIGELREELREQRHAHAFELQKLHNIVWRSKLGDFEGTEVITSPKTDERIKPVGHATSGAAITPGPNTTILATPPPAPIIAVVEEVPDEENSSSDPPTS